MVAFSHFFNGSDQAKFEVLLTATPRRTSGATSRLLISSTFSWDSPTTSISVTPLPACSHFPVGVSVPHVVRVDQPLLIR